MQHEVSGLKQQLSSDQVALYRYRAEQLRQTSDALRQGPRGAAPGALACRRHGDHLRGQTTVKPELESWATEHSASSAAFICGGGVAWLEAPEGSQLLLVANEDFCTWQPTEKVLNLSPPLP